MPAVWSELPDGEYENSSTTTGRYMARTLKIGNDWKSKIPTVKMQMTLEYEKTIEKAVMKNMYCNFFYILYIQLFELSMSAFHCCEEKKNVVFELQYFYSEIK